MLFTDILTIWHEKNAAGDHFGLHSELDRAYMWSFQNLLQFKADRCKVSSLHHQQTNGNRLGGHILQRDSQETYLRVTTQDDICCSKQAERESKTADQHFAILRGQFEPQSFRK